MLSILLINDNKIVSRLLQLSSKKSGFDIEESGVFSPQKEFYNLVFVDSDKYTEALLQKIKENLTYDKLVLISTAQVKKPDGFELVLEKPFLPTDFSALIERNFILDENINNIQEEKKQEKKEKEIDQLPDEDEIDIDLELENFDDEELLEESSTEDLAQMIGEIDDFDEKAENKKKEELSIEDKEFFEEEDDLKINDELLETKDKGENPLPNINDEIEEMEKNENTKTEENTKNQETKKEDTKSENKNNTNITDIQEIIKQKLEEILTPELIKSTLKDMKITISFEDKK